MEQSDIERMHQLNRVFLARNVANANVLFNPTILAISGMLAPARSRLGMTRPRRCRG
jgi:hypothetical protein